MHRAFYPSHAARLLQKTRRLAAITIAVAMPASQWRMVRSAGFEPTTTAFGGRYSIQLSYERMVPARRLQPGAGVAGAQYNGRQPG